MQLNRYLLPALLLAAAPAWGQAQPAPPDPMITLQNHLLQLQVTAGDLVRDAAAVAGQKAILDAQHKKAEDEKADLDARLKWVLDHWVPPPATPEPK